MADDFASLVNLVLERIDRSDEQTDRKIQALINQHASDKADAIERARSQHAENQAAIRDAVQQIATVGDTTRSNATWISERGRPMETMVGKIGDRVTAIEDARTAEQNIARGERRTWNLIYAVAGGVITLIGALLGPDAAEAVKRILHHG